MLKLLVSLVILSIVWIPVSTAQQTVDGDAQAWREVVDSYKRLESMRSYRIKKSGRTSPTSRDPHTIEIVNPDRFHILFAGRAEYIFVRDEAVGRLIGRQANLSRYPGEWICLTSRSRAGEVPALEYLILAGLVLAHDPFLPPLASILPEIEKLRLQVSISRLDESTVEGMKTKGYQYWVIISGDPSARLRSFRERLYVSADTDLPRRMEVLDIGDNRIETVDFHDYDAPIEISLPPRCR